VDQTKQLKEALSELSKEDLERQDVQNATTVVKSSILSDATLNIQKQAHRTTAMLSLDLSAAYQTPNPTQAMNAHLHASQILIFLLSNIGKPGPGETRDTPSSEIMANRRVQAFLKSCLKIV